MRPVTRAAPLRRRHRDAALTRSRVEDCHGSGSGDCFGHDRLRRVVGDAAVTDGRADHVHAPGTRRASVSRNLRLAQPVAGRPHRRFRGDRYDRASCGWRNRRGALYIRSLGSQEARRLSGTDGASYPFWSPDSRFVGFIAGGNLKKIAVAGGPPVTLAEHPGGRSAWSAQGVILYNRDDDSSGLYRIPDNGGQPTRVTELDRSRDELWHAHPIFLPDGRRFLFLGGSNDRSKSAIYLASLDSQTRTRLLDVHSQPDYAAGFLLYQRGGAVMAHPFDEKQGRLTGDAVAIAEGVDTDTINGRAVFSASPNGALIYRSGSASGGSGRLTWFDRSGKTLGTVAENGFYRYPRVSPDGRHVVVTFSKDEVGMDLWQIDLARGVPTRSTFHPDDDFWPSVWSPDSQRVVFSSSRTRKGVFDLYQRSAAGAATAELLWQSGESKSPSGFSPDGRILLVDRLVSSGSSSDMWALPMTGDRKPFPLIETAFNEGQPSFRRAAGSSRTCPMTPGSIRCMCSHSRRPGRGCSCRVEMGGRRCGHQMAAPFCIRPHRRNLGEGLRRRERFHGGRRDDVRIDGARRISSNALHATTHWRRHEWLCRRRVRSALSAGRARSEGAPSNYRLLELAVAVVEEVKGNRRVENAIINRPAHCSRRLPHPDDFRDRAAACGC